MSDVVRKPLGATGIRWVSDSLSRGGPLAAAFLRNVDLQSGEVVGLVPLDASASRLAEPRYGGVLGDDGKKAVLMKKSGEAEKPLEGLVGELAARGAAFVVVEDDVGREGDPRLLARRSTIPVGDGRVVNWMSLSARRSQSVHRFLRAESTGYPTVAFVLAPGKNTEVQDVIDAIVQGDIDSVLAVIVSAYDGETWMIWYPRTS